MNNQLEGIDPKIADKIKKLLNLQKGAEAIGSMAEAENAAQKISALLMQYNIDLAAIEGHEISDKNPVVQEFIDMDEIQGRHEAGWLERLYHVVAQYNLCKVIILTSKKKSRHKYDQGFVAIIGRKDNITIVRYICANLEGQIRRICQATYRKYEGESKPNTFKRGFFRGAVDGVELKLRQLRQQQMNQVQTMAIVKFNDRAVGEYVQKEYPVLGRKVGKGLKGVDAHGLGKLAGYGMNVNPGLDGFQNQKKIN